MSRKRLKTSKKHQSYHLYMAMGKVVSNNIVRIEDTTVGGKMTPQTVE